MTIIKNSKFLNLGFFVLKNGILNVSNPIFFIDLWKYAQTNVLFVSKLKLRNYLNEQRNFQPQYYSCAKRTI